MRALVSVTPPNPNAKLLAAVAKYLLQARGDRSEAAEIAKRVGALPRVVEILRAVPIGTTTDGNFGGVLGDAKIASDSFIESLAGQSILAAMIADNAVTRVPLAQRLGAVISASVGQIVDEGMVIPGSSLQLEGATVPRLRAEAFVVIANEVARLGTSTAITLIHDELSKAVTAVADGKLGDVAMAGAPSFASSGDFNDDVETLLAAVSVPGSRLYWAASADVGSKMALADKHGTMSPQGGAYLGVPAFVSATIPDQTLRLLDARGFGGDLEGVAINTTTQATLDLGSAPDSPPTSATTVLSLWQQNLAAIKATCYLGLVKLRTAAAAEITSIGASG